MKLKLSISVMAVLLSLMLLSCHKQPIDKPAQSLTYVADIDFQLAKEENVKYYIIQSSVNQRDWADAGTGFLDQNNYAKFPVGTCSVPILWYRIVLVYPDRREIQEEFLMALKKSE